MKNIVVTGGSGAAGQYVIKHLLDHDYAVRNLDISPPIDELCPYREVDLTDYGQTFAAMHGCDAVVHFGADPRPDWDLVTGAARFKNNTVATYNVLNSAVALGMERVVWASSETVLGFPFEKVRPDYVPIDEKHRLMPQNSYALSKVVCEELARQMNQLYGIPIIALRFSNILYTGTAHPHNYEAIPNYWSDPNSRKSNFWGYIDVRDAACSTRLALESAISSSEEFNIVAADTIMNRPNAELMSAVYPEVPIRDGTGDFETLISINKARQMLGFEPRFSWRDHIDID